MFDYTLLDKFLSNDWTIENILNLYSDGCTFDINDGKVVGINL